MMKKQIIQKIERINKTIRKKNGKYRINLGVKMQKQKKLTKKRIKQLEKRERNKKYEEWREKVLFRDGHKCVICGEHKKILNCHHIIPKEIKDFKYDIMNGIVLCQRCHRFSFKLSAHQGSFIFFIWLMKYRKEQFEYLSNKFDIKENGI